MANNKTELHCFWQFEIKNNNNNEDNKPSKLRLSSVDCQNLDDGETLSAHTYYLIIFWWLLWVIVIYATSFHRI